MIGVVDRRKAPGGGVVSGVPGSDSSGRRSIGKIGRSGRNCCGQSADLYREAQSIRCNRREQIYSSR